MEEAQMGMLVEGAVKFEEEVQRLKRDVRTMAQQTKARAYAGMRPTWSYVRNSVDGPRVKPILRRIGPFPSQIRRDGKSLLNEAEYHAGTAISGLVDRTIEGLEKVKRKLDQRYPTRWQAA